MTLEKYLEKELKDHVAKMKGMENGHLHGMVMGLVEKSLIQLAMDETSGNQTDASRLLGINRNTLRKKIKDYKLQARGQ